MLNEIKKRIEKEAMLYIRDLDRLYSLQKLSPVLFRHIKDFLVTDGKRIRPLLFIISYLGFSKKPASESGLYRSALSFELLHDFALVHDDIIDKSEVRRGKPSMHNMLNRHLAKYKNIKFNGQDLALILGDVMYIISIDAFLSINENRRRKEIALKKLIEAAIYTATGQFLELLSGTKIIGTITKEDLYKIYDLKTAYYSFASPLVIGAMLAGAKKKEIDRLFRYGMYLGRAFQIRDDILDMFGKKEKDITDLRNAKRTILIWHAYNNSDKKRRLIIEKLLEKTVVADSDLSRIRGIITDSGTLDYAKAEISRLLNKAKTLNAASGMRKLYKNLLLRYHSEIITI
jgi:geranylgeranyl diphosphate synthase, type I